VHGVRIQEPGSLGDHESMPSSTAKFSARIVDVAASSTDTACR
jgi:hypothetical protein